MEIVVLQDSAAVARRAAELITVMVQHRPNAVLGVATGSSPLGVYEQLAVKVQKDGLDFSQTTVFALDEYIGIAADDPHSYSSVVGSTVTGPLKIPIGSVFVPDGCASDPHAAAIAYDQAIGEAGGVDLQLLGLGTNGHIGFNEPMSSFRSRTRVKTLALSTRVDNARFFDGDPSAVPMHCITQGLGTIMEARRVLLVAQGEDKARAVSRMIEGPIASSVPSSALQLHPDAVIIIDRAAAVELEFLDYYAHVQQHKV